jgi:iron complex outermembrane receptor protein
VKDIDPQRNIIDRDLAEISPLRSRASLRYGRRAFFGELELLAVRPQDRVDADLREQRTSGYAVTSVRSGVRISGLNLTVGIENLFDRFYYEHYSFQRDPFRTGVRVPEPGRNFYLSTSYRF